MASPTYISNASTSFITTTTPKSTSLLTVNSGDVLIAYALVEGYSPANIPNAPTFSGSPYTWTLVQQIQVDTYCQLVIWWAKANSASSLSGTFSLVQGVVLANFGGQVIVFSNSSGIGGSAKTNVLSGAPTLNFTHQQNNSAVVCVNADWTAADGTTRTWRTVNGITPTAGNGLELNYARNAAAYTVYGAYYNNVGSIAANDYGISAPGAQKYSIALVEVLGPNPTITGIATITGIQSITF